MKDYYPKDCKKSVLKELNKLTATLGYRESIKLFNKLFQPIGSKS